MAGFGQEYFSALLADATFGFLSAFSGGRAPAGAKKGEKGRTPALALGELFGQGLKKLLEVKRTEVYRALVEMEHRKRDKIMKALEAAKKSGGDREDRLVITLSALLPDEMPPDKLGDIRTGFRKELEKLNALPEKEFEQMLYVLEKDDLRQKINAFMQAIDGKAEEFWRNFQAARRG